MEKLDIVTVLKRQFDPTFLMLQKIVNSCPDDLWNKDTDERPIWIQIYHVAFGIDVWFGETKEYSFPDFGKDVTPLFDDPQDGSLTKREVANYLTQLSNKAEHFFQKLSIKSLGDQSVIYEKYTNLDSVLEQIRHITYHVARINGIFKQHGYKTVGYEYFS